MITFLYWPLCECAVSDKRRDVNRQYGGTLCVMIGGEKMVASKMNVLGPIVLSVEWG